MSSQSRYNNKSLYLLKKALPLLMHKRARSLCLIVMPEKKKNAEVVNIFPSAENILISVIF
jgi:hypothetical protein